MYKYMYIHTFMYIHICIHTYIQIHTPAVAPQWYTGENSEQYIYTYIYIYIIERDGKRSAPIVFSRIIKITRT